MTTINLSQAGLFLLKGDAFARDGGEGYWNTVAVDIARAATAVHGPCVPLDLSADAQAVGLFRMAQQMPPRYLLNINFRPYHVLTRTQGGETLVEYPFRAIRTRHIAVLFDHPLHHVELLAPYFTDCAEAFVGILDPLHAGFLARAGVPAERVFTFLAGGPPMIADPLPVDDRPLGILFSGSVAPLIGDGQFLDEAGATDSAFGRALLNGVERILAEDGDIFDIVEAEFREAGCDIPLDEAARFCQAADRRARTVRRHRMLRALDGLPLHIAGPVDAAAVPPGATRQDATSFSEALELMGRAKVVLCDSVNMRRGVVFRAFYALAQGAAVLSDPNAFLDGEFGRDQGYLPWDGSSEGLRAYFETPGRLAAVAARGTDIYNAGHTWQHRAADLPV